MKQKDVKIGSVYIVKVSGRLAPVRLVREATSRGWYGVNVHTNRQIFIRTAAKLRKEVIA